MKRLTTDNPQNNMETMLNYAYAEDKEVKLRYGEHEAQSLCEYIAHRAAVLCDCEASPDDVMEGTCIGCEPDCALSILNTVAIQAAELRARLKVIEDIMGDDYDPDRLLELVEADRDGLAVVLPCKIGTTVYCFRYNPDGTPFIGKKWFQWRDIPSIGKTIFIDLEEAKAALERIRTGHA